MTKWAKLTDEDKARLREALAEQRPDEEVREAGLVPAKEQKLTLPAIVLVGTVGVLSGVLMLAVGYCVQR